MANDIDSRTPVAGLLRAIHVARSVTRIAFTKGMIGVAALVGSGFVSIDTLTDARPRPTPVSAISERFVFEVPAPTAEAVDLSAARRDAADALARLQADRTPISRPEKTDRLDGHPGCRAATLSLVAGECPASGDGAPAQRHARYLTVERRTGRTTSELVRYPLTDVASD
jgi:hypothetical protein